jgi:hypothetical protein
VVRATYEQICAAAKVIRDFLERRPNLPERADDRDSLSFDLACRVLAAIETKR